MRDRPALTDAQAVKEALGGRTEAFCILVQRHQDYVLRLIGRNLPESEVEDAAQQTFVQAFEGLARLREGDSFKAWLGAIAARRCSDFWRRAKQRREVIFDPTDPGHMAWLEGFTAKDCREGHEALARQREARLLVDKLLSVLAAQDRVAVGLYYAQEYSHEEIGQMLGWGLAKVKVRLFRARARMAKAFATITQGRGDA
ncbi:MAG: RNA polymerase sigma factor [Desulfovibrionaceae bacterium]|nr:RNA polymerase sigma factor [Desulfovibrionaceae bacterium]MBF0514978.1 RNA polymerase sigma factor [Desulfovibrionaceae bacterium]